jgi:hypothetical protein
MNTKLFITLSAAIVFGAVVAYAIITWLRQQEQQVLARVLPPAREIGFAAIAKQRGDLANA